MTKKVSWKEEAWEKLLKKTWDTRGTAKSVEYTKVDLEPILSKYTKSGQGEIRIFHSSSGKINALKKRGVRKVPISRSRWKLVKAPKPLVFYKPTGDGSFTPKAEPTEGMAVGVADTLRTKSNPGETTLLAIAKQVGIISDFYSLSEDGVLFTGGRQKANLKIHIGHEMIDMSKAQIEIDGGYEWPKDVVIVEMKSSFKQKDFDVNQALFPLLKWQKLLPKKKVYSLVLLAETSQKGVEYWAYDIGYSNSDLEAKILKSKKYLVKFKGSQLVRA